MTSAVSSEPEMPLMWRLRRDLEIVCADLDEQFGWTIKDPLQLTYFHAAAEEMVFLRLLDGRKSMSRILQAMEAAFPDSRFCAENFRLFLISAINGGLLTSTALGFGHRLSAAFRRRKAAALTRRLTSFLSIRLRGIDPTPLLRFLDRYLGWVYQPACLAALLTGICSVAFLLLSRSGQIRNELPDIASLMTSSNLPLLLAAVVLIKILHEIGHGLTCHHFGGECHELGVILICFLPLLYCDVSDSWLQRDRRKRMLVAAAGIGVELTLAAVCGLLWMCSVPGLLHAFFLNIMLICSLNTLLINGNPLLRYDGYYVLSDLLRIPNLGPESRRSALALFDRAVFGVPGYRTVGRTLWSDLTMSLFGMCSSAYKLVMLTSIVWFMHASLKPHRLEVVSTTLSLMIAGGIVVGGVRGLRQRYLTIAGEAPRRSRVRAGLSGLLLSTLILLLLPIRHTVSAPFTLTAGVCPAVFVTEPGRIRAQAKFGDVVRKGQILAILANSDLELTIARAEGELAVEQTRVRSLASQRNSTAASASGLPAARKAVEHAESRLATLRQRREQLTIRSPVDGTILPPPNVPVRSRKLRMAGSWFGYAMDSVNQDVWIAEQTLLCRIGQPAELRAMLLVDQSEVEFINPDVQATLRFSSQPGDPLAGQVTTINASPELAVDRELILNKMVAVRDSVSQAPLVSLYGVQVQLRTPLPAGLPPLYSTGMARIECQRMSLAERGWRLLCHTFAFQL